MAMRVPQGSIIFPSVRVGRVIEADLEILAAREKESSIIRELARIASGVIMDYGIGG
jgi:hypothetical protein